MFCSWLVTEAPRVGHEEQVLVRFQTAGRTRQPNPSLVFCVYFALWYFCVPDERLLLLC